jgi:hypothetical protein
MRTAILSRSLLLVPLALGACGQPPAPCQLGGTYLAVFYYRQGSQSGTCGDSPFDFADTFSAEAYGALGGAPREVAWTPGEFAYDPETGLPPDPSRDPTGRGHFLTSTDDPSGLCTAVGTSTAEQQIDGGLVTYDVRRVQVLSSAAVHGTEILADLVITRESCSRAYDVLGIWPPVPCSTYDDCNPLPDPANGRISGSGVAVALPVECNRGPILGDAASHLRTDPDEMGFCFFPDAGPAGFPFVNPGS